MIISILAETNSNHFRKCASKPEAEEQKATLEEETTKSTEKSAEQKTLKEQCIDRLQVIIDNSEGKASCYELERKPKTL